MLFSCKTFILELQIINLIFRLNLKDFSLEIRTFFILYFCFIFKTLVLCLYISFYFRNILFGFGLRVLFVVLQELSVLLPDALTLSLKILLTLLFYMLKLTKQSFESGFFIFKLSFLNEFRIFELQEHFLCGNKASHLFLLVLHLSILLTLNFTFLKLSFLFL